ncbi:hypothetical protein [Sporosarcina ureilytica]|uniref:DUF4901 domain-containing protein n=1 Tax=Sporosarcina ureilytica TaxID=298596 RepID=A0A1D8JEQ3_9BACL|nr:hypothetical protein [Sporosarcina ureilytica]AOV07168.1 hypothetical protein BI350_06190 [Sporosarcina ureilytica]
MDERLRKIADEIKEKFGLEQYHLETYSFHKERNNVGDFYYKCNLEFFPATIIGEVEEDLYPSGTAIVDYNLTEEAVISVVFVEGQSFSTKVHFNERTAQEVADWIEEETKLIYKRDFRLADRLENGYQFKIEIDGIDSSPGGLIEVEFNDEGKLTSYFTYDTNVNDKTVELEKFTLTLEKIEPVVKEQVRFINIPDENSRRFVPIYTINEVFITNDGKRNIPHSVRDRNRIVVNEQLEWVTPLDGEIERQFIQPSSTVSIEEAFTHARINERQIITDDQVKQIMPIVRDVLRTVLPEDSGKWTLATVKLEEHFIEVSCQLSKEDATFFNRKFIVLLDPITLEVLNYMDNGELFEVFDTFTHAPDAEISHEEAFEKLLPSITLTPTYVFDLETEKYILCGLLAAADGIDAVTGEIIPLSDS